MSPGTHNTARQDRAHGQTHPGDPKLQQSYLQGREDLKEHSWGRSICHLAPAILLIGSESSLPASYFKTSNQKFSESKEKIDN